MRSYMGSLGWSGRCQRNDKEWERMGAFSRPSSERAGWHWEISSILERSGKFETRIARQHNIRTSWRFTCCSAHILAQCNCNAPLHTPPHTHDHNKAHARKELNVYTHEQDRIRFNDSISRYPATGRRDNSVTPPKNKYLPSNRTTARPSFYTRYYTIKQTNYTQSRENSTKHQLHRRSSNL